MNDAQPRTWRAPALEQTHDVETPEQVEITYTIAGLGSRLFAALIDLAVVVGGFALLVVGVVLLARRLPDTPGAPPDISASWAMAILYLAQFAFMWGYYVLCEGLADGRTVGKRLLLLRVVREDGLSISFGTSAIRNIMRIVDLQPGVLGGVGIVSILLTRRGKRIGDIVAGTIVVRERAIPAATGLYEPEHLVGEPALAAAEYDLLGRYMERRSSLRSEDRARLAALVANRLRAHIGAEEGTETAALLRLYQRESGLRARGIASRSDTGGAREHHALVLRGRPRWLEFAALLKRAQRRGLASLSEDDVADFAARYRELTADLARLKTATRDRSLDEVFALGRLVASGHNLLYRGKRLTLDRALVFVVADAPCEVRRSLRWVLAAVLLFWVPALIAYAGVSGNPELAPEFLPRIVIERAEAASATPGSAYVEIPDMYRPVAATAIIANNVQVALSAFALGITFAIGTALVLVYNGIAIGGVAGLFRARGVSDVLLAFVAPHGVLELAAIAIAGGAGLMLGGGLLLGGPGGRKLTVVRNARRAIAMMAVVVVLLVFAGAIEGLVSPRTDRPLAWKLGVSGASALLLAAYVTFGGRRQPRSDRSSTLDLEVSVHDGGTDALRRHVHNGHA